MVSQTHKKTVVYAHRESITNNNYDNAEIELLDITKQKLFILTSVNSG